MASIFPACLVGASFPFCPVYTGVGGHSRVKSIKVMMVLVGDIDIHVHTYLPKGAGGVLGDGHITMLASVTVTAVGDGHIRITGLNRHCLRYPYHFRDILPFKMVTPWYCYCRSNPYGRQ